MVVHTTTETTMPTTTKTRRPKTSPDDFASILRAAVLEADRSLYRLALDTGIGQDQLSRFMREERGLSLETAGRLAVHLGYHLKRG
jgi:plasmid maintenance system antidote protein VapI